MSGLKDRIPEFDEAFDALERGDLDAFSELVLRRAHPQCEFHSGIGTAVGGGTYKGADGISSWFRDLIESTSERHWRNRRYEVYGNDVLVFLSDFEFVGIASGAVVAAETGAVFEHVEGLCVRIKSFMSHAEARELAEAHA